jgi:hypothetical protein
MCFEAMKHHFANAYALDQRLDRRATLVTIAISINRSFCMPPVISISDSIFKRPQAPNLAAALVDTPASVIEKLLQFLRSSQA